MSCSSSTLFGRTISDLASKDRKKSVIMAAFGLPIVQSSCEDLQGQFDSITMLNVLEYIEEDDTALDKLFGLMAPNWKLILIVPWHRWLYGSLDHHLEHCHRCTRDELKAKVGKAGFSVAESYHFNPIAVPGWFVNGRILRRIVVPNLQIAAFDHLTFLVRWCLPLRLPVGLSILLVAQRPQTPTSD